MVEGDGRLRSWHCPACASCACNAAVVRAAVGRKNFDELWQRLRTGKETGIACPGCLQSMNATGIGELRLEACPVCSIVWFDAGEWAEVADEEHDPTRQPDEARIARHLALLREARNAVKPVTGGDDRRSTRSTKPWRKR